MAAISDSCVFGPAKDVLKSIETCSSSVFCYCGAIDGHQWAPTSQCCPPSPESESVKSESLFSQTSGTGSDLCGISCLNKSDEDLISSVELELEDTSQSSWGSSRFPPSLFEDLNTTTVRCDGRCPTAVKLKERVTELVDENRHLKEQLELFKEIYKVPGYPEYYNIVYEGDIAVYVYKLLHDYKAGDLKVLVQ